MNIIEATDNKHVLEILPTIPSIFAIDTEYENGDPRTTRLLSIIIGIEDTAWIFKPEHIPFIKNKIEDHTMLFMQDYNHCDTIILYKHGIDIRDGRHHNLIDMHHLLDENAEHGLDSRCKLEFGDDYKARFWGQYKSFSEAPYQEALEYQAKDAIYTYRLGMKDLQSVMNNASLYELYLHGRRLRRAKLDTELNGLCVNTELINTTKVTMQGQIDTYLPKLRGEFETFVTKWELKTWADQINRRKTEKGRGGVQRPTFSFASDSQVRELLYGSAYLGCTPTQRTKKGNPSVDFETLKGLSEDYPELKTLVGYKDLKSVYATFVKGLSERVVNDRIYPYFNISGTATGRISHTDPNMANIPKEGVIRNFFIASPGHSIIGADYAQLEVVIELNLTEDPGLKEIVLGGASKHDLFKDELDKAGFNLPRSQVKNVNFGLQYGAGPKKVAKMVGCSLEEAERIIEVFYTKFNGVKRLKDEVEAMVDREGRVTNLAGRIRRFTKPRNEFERARQHRQAYNFLIQGVAGECCNRAYYRFHNDIKDGNNGRGLFSVHDEIVGEALTDRAEYFKLRLVEIMERSSDDFKLKYRLKANPYGPISAWQKT